MALELMYITNRPVIAGIADRCGVDRIFVDLELRGKCERQGHLDTVISRHGIDDVARIRSSLDRARLLVRVNPYYSGSRAEIGRVIGEGADIVMLPYFKTVREVRRFLDNVGGRARTCLLLETPQAVEAIDEILESEGIDEIHIGLNDLHLGYGMKFMFEPLANGLVDRLCGKFRDRGVRYGFGGIARLGCGLLPAECIITEHYRLGSTMAILSRSFCDINRTAEAEAVERLFRTGVRAIRDFEGALDRTDGAFFARNREVLRQRVGRIVDEGCDGGKEGQVAP